MSTITVEPDLKLALERRAAEAGVSMSELLHRLVEPSEPASQSNGVEANAAPKPKQGKVGDALAELFEQIPIPPVDPANRRTAVEVHDDLERSLDDFFAARGPGRE